MRETIMYMLDGHTPVPCSDIYEWAAWFEKTDSRLVARTEYPGDILVSTVFTGFDSGVVWSDKPILFETMVFGGDFNHYIRKYSTWDEATEGHDIIRRMVEATLNKS